MFRRFLATALGSALAMALLAAMPSSAAPQAAAAVQVLNWTAGDATDGYVSVPTQATAGPATVVFENSANTGNTTGMPHTLTFDTTTEGFNHDVNLNILANPFDSSNGRHEAQITLTPGRYRYFCAIPGHQMVGELVVTPGGPDTTPPTTSATVSGNRDNNGNYLGSATVTISATDTESGVATVEYQVDDTGFLPYTAPVVVTALGDHSVQYRATDVAGNVAETKSVQFRVVEAGPVDTTPPTVSAVVSGDRDGNGDYLGSATVTITATDAGSGVDRVEYSLDGGAFLRYTAPVVVNQVGAHMVHYRATDVAGNTSAEQMVSFTVVARPDTTPPTASAVVTGDRDGNGNYVGSAMVTISATDTESGVDRIEYSLDGAAFVRYPEPVTVTQLGAHTVRYRAVDRAGNTSAEQTVSFTVVAPPVQDTTPPATSADVSGTRDADGNYVGSATVTITATDTESGVDRVEYALDGGAFLRYTAPVVVNQVSAHTVRYRATDVAGNTAAEKTVTFTVVAPPVEDTTPPTTSATVSGNRDNNGNYIDSATVTITATDSQSGVDTVEYAVDGGAFTAYTAPVRVGAAGTHTVRYRATDHAGNTSTEGTVSFRVVEPGPDACPDSDTRSMVIIDGFDSGVTNVDIGNGCTINDLIDEHGQYGDHAGFVRHVDRVTDALVADGVLTRRDKGSIVRAAARSDIGN